jgi:hypothetical protein
MLDGEPSAGLAVGQEAPAMRSRLLAAAIAALALAALPAWAQSAKVHLAAAKKAEKAKQYKKMLSEYQAACAAESTSDCQLGIAEAYARLGQKNKAREAYQTLINDPFAQDSAVVKAKSALARLGAGGSAPDLPALDAPPPDTAVAAAVPGLPSLDAPAAAPAPRKSAKKAEVAAAAPALDLPPLDPLPDLPGAAPAKKTPKKPETKVAAAPPPLDLPALDPIDPAKDAKKPKAKKDTVARQDAAPALPSLDLSPAADSKAAPVLPSLDFGPVDTKKADAKKPDAAKKDALAGATPKAKDAAAKVPAKDNKVAMATPPSPKKDAPKDQLAATTPGSKDKISKDALVAPVERGPAPAASSRATRTIAWVTAGVAVAALGGGAYAYTKATSAQNDLHSGVRTAAQNEQLLGQQKLNRSLSAAGLLGGVVAGGVAAMLFTF